MGETVEFDSSTDGDRRSAARSGNRQALVLLAQPPDDATRQLAASLGGAAIAALHDARLRDLVDVLRSIEQTAMTLVAEDAAAAERLRLLLPPGDAVMVAVATAAAGGPMAVAGWAVIDGLDRSMERVVVVRETALPLPPRTIAAALDALAEADLVAGPTPVGDSYLVGARDHDGAASLATLTAPTMGAIEQAAREDGLVLRRLEPRRTIEPGRSLEGLAGEIERLGPLAPRLSRWLDQHRRGG